MLALGFISFRRHLQVNAPLFAVSPLVQTRDDFFHGSRDSLYISLLVATYCGLALRDDVAVPARTGHIPRRICRLYRYDFIVVIDQWNNAPLLHALS